MLRELLRDSAEPPKVLVVGDMMLDEHVHCKVAGFSPEDDVAPKLQVIRRSFTPGGAANVAANLRALGAKVTLAGRVGSDDVGFRLCKMLDELGVDLVPVHNGEPTTHKTRLVTQHGRQVARIDAEVTTIMSTEMTARMTDPLRGMEPDAVVVSDYGKGVVTHDLMVFLGAFQALGTPVLVDPKLPQLDLYGSVTALTPNELEFTTARERRSMGGPEYVAWLLNKDRAPESLIVTRSGDGCLLFEKKGLSDIKVRTQGVVDPAGCGDSFIAGLAYAVGSGLGLQCGCAFGNACGACAVGHVGVYAVTRADVLAELEKFNYEEECQ